MNSKRFFTTRKLVVMALLSAMAIAVFCYVEFPIPMLLPSFLKFDPSNVITLLAGFALGPIEGVVVCLIKNIVHVLIKGMGTTMGIGDIFDFVSGASFVLTASLIYRRKKTKKNAIIGCFVGALVMAVISLPLNYFIVYPIYFKAYGGEAAILSAYQNILPETENIFQALCIFNFPFTLIKGIVCAMVTVFIYKPLSPILKADNK